MCNTNCDTLTCMAEGKLISVRLDRESLRALRAVERDAGNRSEAIRLAIIEAAGIRQRRRSLSREAKELAADGQDRREKAEIAELMESLRAPR